MMKTYFNYVFVICIGVSVKMHILNVYGITSSIAAVHTIKQKLNILYH